MAFLRSPFNLFLVLLIIAVAFFILYGLGWLSPVVGGVKVITSPVVRGFSWVGSTVGGWFSFIGDISQMDEDNKELRRQVDELLSENTKLKEIVNENELLRQEVGFQHEHEYETAPAAVIGRSPDPSLQLIEINIGSLDGVEENMPVIVSQGLFVGQVTQVFDSTSTVMLATDKQSSVNALVQDTRVSGIVRGEHGLDLRLELIPQNEEVSEGQAVITSGLAGSLPTGLLIGKIQSVQESSNALFKEARIDPAVNFDKLELVFVVLGSK